MVSGKYFNKGVKALNDPNVGFVVRETPDKIVIFGEKTKDTMSQSQTSSKLGQTFC